MKRSSKWDEKTIENQLRKMPKIKDNQSKEALFARIQDKMQEENVKVNKKKSWIFPTVASAAVLFLLFLIIPPFLNEQEMTIDSPESDDEANFHMETNEYLVEDADNLESEDSMGIQNIGDELIDSLYFGAVQTADELQFSGDLITIGIVAHYPTGETVLPITVLASGNTKLDKFKSVMESFSGEQWGITRFPSIDVNSITEDNGTVLIDVPMGSLESLSSTLSNTYRLALEETFSFLGFNKITFTSDKQSGVMWGQEDVIEEMSLQLPNRGYYLFESHTGHQFLVKGRSVNAPLNNENFDQSSLEEVIDLMKQGDETRGYQSTVPEGVVINNVEAIGEVATITFDEKTISEIHEENLIMIEAIMFAAKDFGIRFIQFEGLNVPQLGPYMVEHLIEIPNFPNFIR